MLFLKTIVFICFYKLSSCLLSEHEMSREPIENTKSLSNRHFRKYNFPLDRHKANHFKPFYKNRMTVPFGIEYDNKNNVLDSVHNKKSVPIEDRSIILQNLHDSFDKKIHSKRDFHEDSEGGYLENSEDQSENEAYSTSFNGVTSDNSNGPTPEEDASTIDGFSDEELNNKELKSSRRKTFGENLKDDSIQDVLFDTPELEELSITYGTSCDRINNGTCWIEHAVGETLTLDVNISDFQTGHSIEVQWTRVYRKRIKNHDVEVKIEPDRMPWNMVMGSGGRELRLNPVTNVELDPNALVAKVFLVTSKKDFMEKNKLIKRLEFRIEMPATDLNRINLGGELHINLENYMSLPANGDLTLEWRLEKPNGQALPLPSNFKVSKSGRYVIVKEIRKEHLGMLTCTVFSSNNIAVAKRRFLLDSNSTRQSKVVRRHSSLRRRRTFHGGCFRDPRTERIMDYNKRKSRKKRKKSGSRHLSKRGCKTSHSHQRLHPRWIPLFFGAEETTLDPRLMSIEKLIDLSEYSDGTLDNVIPHEIHYVEAVATVISDDFEAPSAQANCSKDSDCGTGAFCLRPKGQKRIQEIHEGFCYCKPEYFGDGFECTKIPRIHRDKRIKRSSLTIDDDLQIQARPFNSQHKVSLLGSKSDKISMEEEKSSKEMEYEEEDAFLLSTCSNSQDCSPHATCQLSRDRHSFCKCNPGYRGNGIFCWEMMDYLPISKISDDSIIK